MPSHYDYDLIRDYLHGLVDQHTARDIRELIQTDETARSIAEGILYLEKNFGNEREVEEYLDNFHHRQQTLIASTTPRRLPLWLKIAASVLIVATVGSILILNLSTTDPIALIERELAEPYPASSIVRGDNEISSLQLALELYSKENYREALKVFNEAPDARRDATWKFYQALSFLYVHEYGSAVQLLVSNDVAKSRFATQAQWYAALALIKSGQVEAARSILTEISSDNRHYKNREAIDLLGSL